MEISNCLSESDISLEVDGRDKPEILKNLVDVFTKSTPLDNKTEVLNLLLEREKLKTTGIGSGVAIPNCKISQVDRIHIIVGLSKKGIDFNSLDNNPAHLFFLIIAPESSSSGHLKICAKVVRLVRDAKVREELLAIPTAEGVMTYIREKESALN